MAFNNTIHIIRITPKIYSTPDILIRKYLITEDGKIITTEDGKKIRI